MIVRQPVGHYMLCAEALARASADPRLQGPAEKAEVGRARASARLPARQWRTSHDAWGQLS